MVNKDHISHTLAFVILQLASVPNDICYNADNEQTSYLKKCKYGKSISCIITGYPTEVNAVPFLRHFFSIFLWRKLQC